jgi:hypothetical protein
MVTLKPGNRNRTSFSEKLRRFSMSNIAGISPILTSKAGLFYKRTSWGYPALPGSLY